MTLEPRNDSTEQIGKHVILYEDTLLHVRWVGDHTLAEQHKIYERIGEYLDARGMALLLFDLRAAGPLKPEHRQASATWWRNKPLESIAVAQYGMGQSIRFSVDLIARAIESLAKKEFLLESFDQETDARQWLAAIAKELRPFR